MSVPAVTEAFSLASARHRGPVFLDASLEALFGTGDPAGRDRHRRDRHRGSTEHRSGRAARTPADG